MTGIWCFTCSHEIRQEFAGGYSHADQADEDECVCIDDELGCQP